MGQKNGKMSADMEPAGEADVVNRSMSIATLRGRIWTGRKRSCVPSMDREATETPIYLTADQKNLIRESFEVIKQTIGDVGVVFFMR